MNKEYEFNGKSYIVAKRKKKATPCFGCAFDKETNDTCRQFEIIANAPDCTMEDIIFKEKPVESVKVNVNPPKLAMSNDTILQYRKETSWGVNPSIGDKVNPLREKNPIMSNNPNQTYSFEIKLNNGLRFVAPRVTLSTVAPDCKITAATLPSTERFIVCLLENGKLAPSTEPYQHKNRESADKEALRLCKMHHQEFVVLQIVSAVKPQEPKKEVFA